MDVKINFHLRYLLCEYHNKHIHIKNKTYNDALIITSCTILPKYALFKILADVYYEYATKYDGLLQIPLTVSNRTSLYLELSCNIVQWFKNSYEQTTDIVYSKLKDVFLEFKQSDYYINLSKNDKRKYNKTFFINYFETNIYLKKYYTMTKKLKLHTVYIMYK